MVVERSTVLLEDQGLIAGIESRSRGFDADLTGAHVEGEKMLLHADAKRGAEVDLPGQPVFEGDIHGARPSVPPFRNDGGTPRINDAVLIGVGIGGGAPGSDRRGEPGATLV